MGRSDSSDSEYERKRKSKKREKRRSSSTESSSRRRSRKSSRDRHRSRTRSRSRDRRRNRSRSLSRDRPRRDRRERSRSRSRDRRERSRSRSRDERRQRKDESSLSNVKHEKGIVKSSMESSSSSTLKDKISALTMKAEPKDELVNYKPTEEELRKIDKESFVQEHFSKTYNQDNPVVASKSKKKKKKKHQQQQQQQNKNKDLALQASLEHNVKTESVKISHDDAIFGTTKDTLHLSRFSSSNGSSRISSERVKELKSLEDGGDLIFGAMFCEKPEIRQKRWLEKLQIIRQRLLQEGY